MVKKQWSDLDFGGAIRSAHDLASDALRTIDINSIIPSKFDKFEVTYNGSNLPTNVKYFINEGFSTSRLTLVGDTAGSLNSKYFLVNSGNNELKYYVWYNVNSLGVDPAIAGRTGVMVSLNTNDHAYVVALATKLTLDSLGDFYLEVAQATVVIRTLVEGFTDDIDVDSTGFTQLHTDNGKSTLIANITLTYVGNNPVYLDQELKGYKLNVYTGKFELKPELALPVGQQTMANSTPVVIASDQSPIQVTVVSSSVTQNVTINYTETTGIAAGITTNIGTYTVPAGKTAVLQKIFVSGENVSKYTILLNGNAINTKRTNYTNLNEVFDFLVNNSDGYILSAGDILLVKVLHDRPTPSDYETTIEMILRG